MEKRRQLPNFHTEINVDQSVLSLNNVPGNVLGNVSEKHLGPGKGSPSNTIHLGPHFSCYLFFPYIKES